MPLRTLSMTPLAERLTDGVAILAVLSWINSDLYVWLQQTSEVAALVTPIFGLLWLIVQIYFRVTKGK